MSTPLFWRGVLMTPTLQFIALAVLAPVLTGCSYAGLVRPSVLKELNPRVAALVNELPNVDHPNNHLVAKIYALGGLSHAKAGRDGVMRAGIRVPKDQYIWEPAFIVMPHAGELELEFDNRDQAIHMAFLPSNGGRQLLYLPVHRRGTARITLDQPGLYWFGCPVANHAGRGMLGFIWVYGETPKEARLDRPPQPQPESD